MKIGEKLRTKKTFSMEVFPPKRDGDHLKLLEVVRNLKGLNPDYISVTYGAGGTTRSLTKEIASEIKNEIGIESMAHLTCVGNTREEIGGILDELQKARIHNILALRGDPPQGEKNFTPVAGGFHYASELVEYIKESHPEFSIGVAGYPEKHPQAKSLEEDIEHLREKVSAGGEFIITQAFFNNDHYFRFYELLRKKDIQAPVIPGIFLISSYKQLQRIEELSGSDIPAKLTEEINRHQSDPDALRQIGIEYAFSQSRAILEQGAAQGLHFYIMNRQDMISELYGLLPEL